MFLSSDLHSLFWVCRFLCQKGLFGSCRGIWDSDAVGAVAGGGRCLCTCRGGGSGTELPRPGSRSSLPMVASVDALHLSGPTA